MVPPSGPVPARIMIVGEAPGETEVVKREPFVGASGQELNRMLHEARIMRSECFLTNVCRERPPSNDITTWFPKVKKDITPDMVEVRGHFMKPVIAEGLSLLAREIELVRPNIIIAFGNLSLWALTGKWGIKSWRGSLLTTESGIKVIPAYHPAYILRDWSVRAISVSDLKRAAAEADSPEVSPPDYDFIIRPSFPATIEYLHALQTSLSAGPRTLSVDIETRAGHTACLGIATSRVNAFCIPFMCVEDVEGYWPAEQEATILALLQVVLCHPNARVIGQNFIYDSQYIYRHWGFVPNFARDTMLGHHACFSGLPKGLDYLSSMYCQKHIFWKGESKDWDPKLGEDQLWIYNCKDCVITYEVDEAIQAQVDKMGLRAVHDFQQSMFYPVLEAMLRGVRVDSKRRSLFALTLSDELAAREQYFIDVLGHPLNPRSPLQMKRLFYEDLNQKAILSRKTGSITLDDEALQKIARREPILRPLVRRISEYRSLGVFLSTFVNAKLDVDHRLRCSYNIAGTETYRLSSSQNAFDSGLNLQNIPKGGSATKDDPDALELPNVRTLFVPDPGQTFFDADLDRADLQVVVWEADDAELRAMLLEGVDIHSENAKTLGVSRALAKAWVHGTNYGGGPRTMAANCGLSIAEAERMRLKWFSAHPGIANWHRRTEDALRSRKFVENRFGNRRYYFDRIDGLLPEALAWIPQSTVAVYINRVWKAWSDKLPDVQVLLQVHDSLCGQFPTHLAARCVRDMKEVAASISVPYDRPLVIPLSIKTSAVSWGDCDESQL